MPEIFKEIDILYELSVISAHRNPEELRKYCLETVEKNPDVVFICAAGMSAALPGAVASIVRSNVRNNPVIGVALISDVLDGMDALLSMTRMPSGIPVGVTGIGKSGLDNAALLASQIIARTSNKTFSLLNAYIKFGSKPAQLRLNI